MNISQAIHTALEELSHRRAEATARTYRAALNYLLLYLDTQDLPPTAPVRKVKIQHLIDFFPFLNEVTSAASGDELTRGTRRVYVSGIKYFFDWLVLQNLLRPAYADGIRFEKAASEAVSGRGRHFPKTPSKGAVEKVMAAVSRLEGDSPMRERDVALCHFLYSSGCRAGEVVALQIGDLDLEEKMAVVLGKGDKHRTVFYSQETARALRAYWQARDLWAGHKHSRPEAPVFCRHDPGTWARNGRRVALPLSTYSVRKIVAKAARLADLDENFTPHSFRHAFAIQMLRKTRDIAAVQRLLGHEDPATTTIYAEIYPDELMEAHREVWDNPYE
jgi:site-specific recombinase XerD